MTEETLSFLQVAQRVGSACEHAGFAYLITGSVAGTLQGVIRSTQDIDIVVEMTAWGLAKFVAALGPDFEVDQESLAEAIRTRGSWNVFHLPTMTKIDLFMLTEESFAQASFQRRVSLPLPEGGELKVMAAEDLVLQKLLWFRKGGEVSQQQWRDVVGLLNANPTLDCKHLDAWAKRLGIDGLLTRARLLTPISLKR